MAVRVVGPEQWILIPALIVIAATIVLAIPMRVFGLSLPEPVLPMLLAFAWPLVRPSVLAPLVLAALGLFLDLFWGGPLGLWPLVLLVVYGVILAARNILAGQESIFLFLWYAGGCLLAFLIAWLAVSSISGSMPSLWAVLLQVLPTLALFPIALFMLDRFDDGDVRFR
ncbi:hypothetical protein ACIQC9_04005 [Brevundimonas sp. NPDC092305]|uniref:hypothetical protein n=1 Tax=Brevundimonas sp. NPDC092305 TaxID=3363957 RepID=UPI00381BE6F5